MAKDIMFHLTLLFNRCDSTSYKLILYINHNTPFLIPFLCFMKKLLLLLIILTTLTNLSYASFPVETHIDESRPIEIGDIFGSIVGLVVLYFLLRRFIMKGNRRTKRVLLFVFGGILFLLLLIALSSGPIGLFV